MAELKVTVYNVTSKFPLVTGDAKVEDVLPLAAAITDTIDPRSWEAFGGDGSLRVVFRSPSVKAWLFVVRQTEDVHTKIHDALDAMMKT